MIESVGTCYTRLSAIGTDGGTIPLPCWPPHDRKPVQYRVGNLRLESDAVECVVFDRVFPIFDDESVLLTRTIDSGNGRFLDIGTGSGIQALIAAACGWTTVGTDVNLRALSCAAHNAAQNGLSDRVCWYAANLFEGTDLGVFNRIIANPPFLPSPTDVRLPLSSNGGLNGLKVVDPLVRSVRNHLLPGGVFTLLAVSIGTRRKTLVEKLIRESFNSTTDSIVIEDLYGEALPLTDLADCFSGSSGVKAWMRSMHQEGLCELRYLLFNVRRDGRAPQISIPALEHTKFSGGWQGRLTRYRAWLERLGDLNSPKNSIVPKNVCSDLAPIMEFV